MLNCTLTQSKQVVKKAKNVYTYDDMPNHELIGETLNIPAMPIKISKAKCQNETGKIYLDKVSAIITTSKGKNILVWISVQDNIDGIEVE